MISNFTSKNIRSERITEKFDIKLISEEYKKGLLVNLLMKNIRSERITEKFDIKLISEEYKKGLSSKKKRSHRAVKNPSGWAGAAFSPLEIFREPE